MRLSTYAQLVKNGQVAAVDGLCGRILRGKSANDFLTLTDDPERKLVLLVGPDGLEKLLGKTGLEMLVEIGYEADYIVRKVKEGNQFKLVVFEEGGPAKLATWDNVIETVIGVYPEAAIALNAALPLLKTAKFDEIERLAGFDFSEVDKAGKADPRFMTYDRFKQSGGGLINTRAFLYFTVHLRELYAGDGYTYTNDGRRGLQEYIVANKPIAELGASEMIDLEVALPVRKSKLVGLRGLPSFWNPDKIGQMYMPDLATAKAEARKLNLLPAHKQKDRHLLVLIDEENDFTPDGRLPVPGMYEDVARLGDRMIKGILEEYYTDLIITIDTHPSFAIHTDTWYRDEFGNPPDVTYPVCMELIDPVEGLFQDGNGKRFWPRMMKKWTVTYAQHLKATGQGNIWVFADHCRQGTDGVNLVPALAEIVEWAALARDIQPAYMYKGMIAQVDWFGPFRPCMDVPDHPQGGLQTGYLDIIAQCKTTEITGEAKDFCVKAGMLQVLDYYKGKPDILKSISFIDDTTSAIFPNDPNLAAFMNQMRGEGINIINHDNPFVR